MGTRPARLQACQDRLLARRQQAAARRIEKMPAAARPRDLRKQQLVIALVVDRVDRRRVDDQQRRGIVAMKETRIRLRQPLEVSPVDGLLVADSSSGDAIKQYIDR